ncbi:class I SAM-dependent methyltransferase [Hamadaea tsunoensis]|uniref:class I SAM-dependent methyltransferase n=1 Tax=Hamadaea tsunoensis TaxID=53368 RepID=UPI000415546B|nr:class I SAM-dependent methyltransferase [Hamadaea tsunoensis]
MPTTPSEPHRARRIAEGFGTDAERYDRTRPSYPAAMVDAVVAAAPGPDFLDVGIGTGIAARRFRAAGRTVHGVEVDERMAALARRDGFTVDVARFEDWDAAGRTFDAVVAGQTWHWIDPVAGAARAAEVLRPAGRLALFWNALLTPEPLARSFAAVYRRVLPDLPFDPYPVRAADPYAPMMDTATSGLAEAGGFGVPQRWSFDWEQTFTRDEWLDVVPTHGGHNLIPPDQSAALLAGLGEAVDAVGGSFVMPITTVVLTALRI